LRLLQHPFQARETPLPGRSARIGAVSVTVTVAISISVASLGTEVVDHQPDGAPVGGEPAQVGGERAARGAGDAHHAQDTLDVARDQGRVAHARVRRGVEKDELVAPAECRERLAQRRAADQLGRVGRDRAAGQEIEAERLDRAQRLAGAGAPGEHVAQPGRLGHPEVFVGLGLAEVGVDEQHPLAVVGQRRGEFVGGGGFAVAGGGGGDHPQVVAPGAPGKVEVAAPRISDRARPTPLQPVASLESRVSPAGQAPPYGGDAAATAG